MVSFESTLHYLNTLSIEVDSSYMYSEGLEPSHSHAQLQMVVLNMVTVRKLGHSLDDGES